MKVLDKDGFIVAVETEGEIWVRTPYAMLEYHNNQALTEEVTDSKGWYSTG